MAKAKDAAKKEYTKPLPAPKPKGGGSVKRAPRGPQRVGNQRDYFNNKYREGQ